MDASLGFGQTDRSECLHGFPAVGGSLTLAFVDYTVVATFPPNRFGFWVSDICFTSNGIILRHHARSGIPPLFRNFEKT